MKKGNPTAGILMLLGASLLLVLVTTKRGKLIMKILFGFDNAPPHPGGGGGQSGGAGSSGSYDEVVFNIPGFIGAKGAKPI